MNTLPKVVNFGVVTAIAMAIAYFLVYLAGVSP